MEHGANFDKQDKQGQTALFLAAKKNEVKMAKVLLAMGADPNMVNKNGMPPLYTSLVTMWNNQGVDTELFGLLLNHSASHDGSWSDGGTAVQKFSGLNFTRSFSSRKSYGGYEMYNKALEIDLPVLFELLLQHDLDPSFRMNSKFSLGHFVINKDYTKQLAQIATLLLKQQRRLKREHKDKQGYNMLDFGTSKGGKWKEWADEFGAYLGRYLREVEAEYRSATAKVYRYSPTLFAHTFPHPLFTCAYK